MDREADARRFAAFLVTSGVTAHAEQDGEGWAIWVRDENQVEAGRTAFRDFRRNPDDARYRGVERDGRLDSPARRPNAANKLAKT